MSDYDLGMVGLGTMGRSLLLNMANHGFRVAGYDTDPVKVGALNESHLKVHGFQDLGEFVRSIRKPRAIMMLVPAGAPVDSVLANLKPFLESEDFVIDGGNSYYKDTERRIEELSTGGFGFMGMGISGGEAGALHGPSMMPGGRAQDYERVRPLLESVAARFDDQPCVALMGSGAAGHYVKTVHNGIEYGLMQLIAETYDFMKRGLCMDDPEIGAEFAKWNGGELSSFLVGITAEVLSFRDPDTGKGLVSEISDRAKQKGTGKWTSQDAMDLGIPVPTIDAAVAARELSGLKPLRVRAAERYSEPVHVSSDRSILPALSGALQVAALVTYSQGFSQLAAASEEYGFGTNLETAAKIWRAGCIIRSEFLEPIRAAFAANPSLDSLLLAPEIAKRVSDHLAELRQVVGAFVQAGIPSPSLSATLAYLDGLRSARLPANLIQAQRDYFGAHGYERLDREGTFHTQWAPL